ncbi:DUF1998 domain-containing protein [Aeromicrobium sp. S22]|uniref:DUF1998 domain-containing protein n=1 Tax=Aeromicrobium sp. S22 TaxID=2662029 RepID=UPI00129E723D|nr:DUF1998 domain-containing protein [Aeromicrobium sp. S22]MRK01377.1 DUF1998 domain-containing protein [Aeromicrobium sp. S22]
MANNVAESRRTQLVSTYGIGALFPAQDESFMILGLDDWRVDLCREIPEPRLARSLGVQTFRLPPSGSHKERDVPVIRFPSKHYCPSCRRLDDHFRFCTYDKNVCEDCSRTITPSRFVVSCTAGHIDEFPYFRWLHVDQEYAEGAKHEMRLTTLGESSSLRDIVLTCSCGVKRKTMANTFGAKAMVGVIKCAGRRPWLQGAENEVCSETPRTMQRGSSSVWFPAVRSAISIPPWSDKVHKLVGKYWPVLEHIPLPSLRPTVEGLVASALSGVTVEDVISAVLQRKGLLDGSETVTEQELRDDEFKALFDGYPEESSHQQFVAKPIDDLPVDSRGIFSRVCEVSRLREVRALHGFSRVTPADGDGAGASSHVAKLSQQPSAWLPAIEVHGEGIFMNFDEEAIEEWADSTFVTGRTAMLQHASDLKAASDGGAQDAATVSAKRVFLHTLSHVLINELSLDAGYPAASLRERLYTGDGQAGVLIYTASADSAGSLGGLSAQADGDLLWAVLKSGIDRASWCSTDPVCIESTAAGKDALNLAACHACLLVPETSCEVANTYLDRALLVGTPDEPDAGFFADLARR